MSAPPPPAPPPPEALTSVPAVTGGDAGDGFRPVRLPYVSGDPVPPGYEVQRRASSGAIASGTIILGASYLTALLAGGGEPGSGYRFVPILGPFQMIASRDLKCGTPTDPALVGDIGNDCAVKVADEARAIAWLLADGLVQITGASVLLIGLLTGEEQLVRSDTVVRAQLGSDSVRFSVSGRF